MQLVALTRESTSVKGQNVLVIYPALWNQTLKSSRLPMDEPMNKHKAIWKLIVIHVDQERIELPHIPVTFEWLKPKTVFIFQNAR